MTNTCHQPVLSEYEASEWGWNDKNKKEEMREKDPWFLVARDSVSRDLAAFAHFKFDFDEEIEVLYCYEVIGQKRNSLFEGSNISDNNYVIKIHNYIFTC